MFNIQLILKLFVKYFAKLLNFQKLFVLLQKINVIIIL